MKWFKWETFMKLVKSTATLSGFWEARYIVGLLSWHYITDNFQCLQLNVAFSSSKKNHCNEPLSNVHTQYNHNFQPKVKIWKKENKKCFKNAVTLLTFVSSPQRSTNSILLQVRLEKDKPVVWLQYKLLRSNHVYWWTAGALYTAWLSGLEWWFVRLLKKQELFPMNS